MSMPRLAWASLPPTARSAVQERTGPVLTAQDVSTGANSGLAVKLHTRTGPVFVKGIPLDSPQCHHQQREADINPFLPPSAPRLLWHVQDGGWDLLGFELIEGRTADFSPDSPDLPLVVDALAELAATPCPDSGLKTVPDRWGTYATDPELFAGDTLLHTDMAPHNLLVADRAHLIDWAWPTRGAAWVDPAVWAVRLIDAGHIPEQAEAWAAKTGTWNEAPPTALTSFARANALLWEEIAANSSIDWHKSMAHSGQLWADYRVQAT